MLDPDEKESQVQQYSVEFVSSASSQGTTSPTTFRAESHDGTKITSGLNLDQESIKSRVDETQFENIEPDTQVPERLRSRVNEPQYAHLELDSQAPDHTTFATTIDIPLLHKPSMPHPRVANNASFATIVRPVIDDTNDISTIFKFGKANRPFAGQFNAKIRHKKKGPREDNRIPAASLPSGHCSSPNLGTTMTGKSSSSSSRTLNAAFDQSVRLQALDQPSYSTSRTPVVSKQSNSISIAGERTDPRRSPQSPHDISSSSTTSLTTNLYQQKKTAAEDSNNNSSFHACQQDLGVNSPSEELLSSSRRTDQAVPDAANIHTSRSIPPLQHVDQPPAPSHKIDLLPSNKVSTDQDARTSPYIVGEDAASQICLVSIPSTLRGIPSSNEGRPTSLARQIPRPSGLTPLSFGLSGSVPSGSKTPRRRGSGRVKPCGFPGRISPRTPKTAVRLSTKHPFPDVYVGNPAQVAHHNTDDIYTTREINDTHIQPDFLEYHLKPNLDVKTPKGLTENFDSDIQNSFDISEPRTDTPLAPFGSGVSPQQAATESSSRAGSQCPATAHTAVRSRPPSRSNMAARMNRSSNPPIQRKETDGISPAFSSHQCTGVPKLNLTTSTCPRTPPAPLSHTLQTTDPLLSAESAAKSGHPEQEDEDGTAVTVEANSTVFGELFERLAEAHTRYISASGEVEAQHEELEKLRISKAGLQKRIQDLENEKSVLSQDLKKFSELSNQYTKHMNRVVIAQNELKQAAILLRNDSSEAIELCNASKLVASEVSSAASGISCALQEIKTMRIEADKAVTEERKERTLVSALRSQIERSTKENQATVEQLTEVSNARAELQIQFDDLKQTNESLDKTIESYLIEMQIDKNTAEKLQAQLNAKIASEKAMVKLIENIPNEILKKFVDDEGVLARILGANVVTQAKLEEISSFIEELQNLEVKPTATLIELIKNLSDRIPEPQSQKDTDAPREQFISKLFDNLKTWFNQFSLKSQTDVDLENQISELQVSNRDLELNIKDEENKKKDLETRIQTAERNLSDCRKQLESKSEELAAALAVPKEDHRLLARISELESSRSEVCRQLETSGTKVVTLEQENTSLKEAITTAETKINSLEQNQAKLVVRHEEETQKTAALAEKNKTENDAKKEHQLSNLRNAFAAKEADLEKANDELNQAIEEVQLLKSHTGHEQREAFIDLMELRKSFDLDTRTGAEGSAINRVEERLKETTSKLESAREDAAKIGVLAASQAVFDSKLKKNEMDNGLLRKEIAELKAENSRLLKLHGKSRLRSSPAAFAMQSLSIFDKEVTVTQSVLGTPEETLTKNTTSRRSSLGEYSEIPKTREESLDSVSQQTRKPGHGIAEDDASTYFNSSCKAPIQKNPKKGQVKDLNMMFRDGAKAQRENRPIQAYSVQSKSARQARSSHSTAHPPSSASSGRSSTSSFTDLSMPWDTMDGRQVDLEHEKRRREKHEALTKPAQSVVSQRQRPLVATVLCSSESLVSQHADVTAIFTTKQRREPGHRQPQADLKSAMKPTFTTAHTERTNSHKNAIIPAQASRRNMPLQEKSTARGANKSQMVTTRRQPPYNRVAGSLQARDEAVGDKTHDTIKPPSENSPVHNGGALRRSNSWKGFGSNNKRTAETAAEPSKPAKAPRMSFAPGHGLRK